MVADPMGGEPHRHSSRLDLVSSLLREADLTTSLKRANDSVLFRPNGEWVDLEAAGASGVEEGDDGAKPSCVDRARVLTGWFLRGKTGLEELLLQLHFGHFSPAEIESVASILWGTKEVGGLLHNLIPSLIERIDSWLVSPKPHFFPYIFLHSVECRCRRHPEGTAMQLAAAVGINERGYREVLGIVATPLGAAGMWDSLLTSLAARGVRSPRVIVGATTDSAMRAAATRRWRGCGFLMPCSELGRGLFWGVSPSDLPWVDQGVAELAACVNREDCERSGQKLQDRLKKAGYPDLSTILRERLHRHLAYFEVPRSHRSRLRSANIVRTELIRVRGQARVLSPIHDEKTLVLLAAATFRWQCRNSWNAKPFLYD